MSSCGDDSNPWLQCGDTQRYDIPRKFKNERSVSQMKVQELKQALFTHVQNTEIGAKVVKLLMAEGNPPHFETELWDFKRKAPELPVKSS